MHGYDEGAQNHNNEEADSDGEDGGNDKKKKKKNKKKNKKRQAPDTFSAPQTAAASRGPEDQNSNTQ